MSVRIITDSTADVSPASQARLTRVPLTIFFGTEEFVDGVTITHTQFYEKLVASKQLPTTSQPTPAAFEQVYQELVEAGHEVVVITIASKLSGTYQSATIAAEEFPGKVFVVDSRNAALASGVLAEYALKLAKDGWSGEQILEELMEKRRKLRLYAIVDTLEYLKKGGRLSSTVAFVGGVLNLKPVICVEDGEIKTVGKARGSRAAFSMLTKECANHGGVDFSMPTLLGYTGSDDEQLKNYMASSAELWSADTRTSIVGSAIGVHAGPGAVALGFFSKE